MKKTVFAFALLLTGCNLPYRPPSGATNIAKVRFNIPEAGRSFTNVAVYALDDGASCSTAKKLRLLGGLQLGGMASKDVDIGMLKDPRTKYEDNLYVEIPVVAEKRFNFALAGHHALEMCYLTMSFLPKTDRQYEVTYFTDPLMCHAAIFELTSKDGQVLMSEEPTGQKNEKTCKVFWN